MKNRETLEDNWHDIVSKAMRGQQLDISLLAERSQLEESSVCSIVEEGMFNEQTLVAIAPILNLNPEALLVIAHHPYGRNIPEPPRNFKRFTTSYHGMQVNSYLLWSEENKTAIAFDTGADLPPLLQQLREHQLKLSAIFLTHGHGDHISQLKNLIAHTGALAWIDEHDMVSGAQYLPLRRRHQLDSTITIEARPTPGHSLGGTTFVIYGTSPMIAVVGDALFAGSIGGIPPGSYQAALKEIQEKILSLPNKTIITPGHGPLTTVENEKKNNPFFACSFQ